MDLDNDTKFWLFRIGYWVLSSIDCTFLFKLGSDVANTGSAKSYEWLWAVLSLVFTAASAYLWLSYRSLRKLRGTNGGLGKTPEQIEIETLAAYAAMQKPPTDEKK